jgi:hypothetical protein
MLADARALGLDVNRRVPATKPPNRISVYSGEFRTEEGDDSYVRQIVAQFEAGEIDSTVVCFVQGHWHWSIQETAEVLQLGVRIYASHARLASVARVPVMQLDHLLGLPQVRWIGEFKPEHKYRESDPFPTGDQFADALIVESLVGDSEECREDLARIGARIIRAEEDRYFALVAPEKIRSLAELWWVNLITCQPTMPHADQQRRPLKDEPERGDRPYDVNFHPQDSRLLVSAGSPGMSRRGQSIRLCGPRWYWVLKCRIFSTNSGGICFG